jgi:hypothetical protein
VVDVVGDRSTIRSNNDVPKASDDMMMTVVVGVLLRREDMFLQRKTNGSWMLRVRFRRPGNSTLSRFVAFALHIYDESM